MCTRYFTNMINEKNVILETLDDVCIYRNVKQAFQGHYITDEKLLLVAMYINFINLPNSADTRLWKRRCREGWAASGASPIHLTLFTFSSGLLTVNQYEKEAKGSLVTNFLSTRRLCE